jgi:hypothetical protein
MRYSNLTFMVTAIALGACSRSTPEVTSGDISTVQLTAKLVSPIDVELTWKDTGPTPALYAVEWTNSLEEGYVVLEYLPSHQTRYKHPDLMEESPNYYRVRPIYGPASSTVEITVAKGLSDAAYVAEFDKPTDVSWAVPTIVPGDSRAAQKSIRVPANVAAATPSDLKGVVMQPSVSNFKVTWADNASDEQGYLVEMKPEGAADYKVIAILEPDVNSVGYALEPPVRKALLRARAYYSGKLSNTELKKTGLTPSIVPPQSPQHLHER